MEAIKHNMAGIIATLASFLAIYGQIEKWRGTMEVRIEVVHEQQHKLELKLADLQRHVLSRRCEVTEPRQEENP